MNVEKRLERLERENRRWRLAAAFSTVLLAIVLGCSQSPPRISAQPRAAVGMLRGTGLEIVNTSEVVVAKLVPNKTGAVLFLHSSGKGNLWMSSDDLGATLTVKGEGGHTQLSTSGVGVYPPLSSERERELQEWSKAHPNGTVTQADNEYFDNNFIPKPAVRIGAAGEGGGFVDVFNPQGKQAAALQCNNKNEGLVIVYDVNGKASNSLSTKP